MTNSPKNYLKLLQLIFAICISLTYCGCKQSGKQSDKHSSTATPRIYIGIEAEMHETITPRYLNKLVADLVVPHFEKIDSITFASPSPYETCQNLEIKQRSIDEGYSRSTEYYTSISISGFVYGKAKKSLNQRYTFNMSGIITQRNLNDPLEEMSRNLTIKGENGEYIYRGEELEKGNGFNRKSQGQNFRSN